MTAGILIDAASGATITTGIHLNVTGVITTGIDIEACATANIAISGTNATGIAMTGTYSTAAISIATVMAAYNDYCLYIAAECDDTSGNVLPLYVTSNIDGAGATGRAAEFLLAPTVQMGGWGNAIKGYLNLTDSAGGIGTLSAICAEVLFPDEQQVGSIGILELEAVANTSYVYEDYTSVILFQLAGTDTSSFQDGAYFLFVGGLSSSTGDMWYNNTLKCRVTGADWYLPFSSAQGSFTTAYPIASTYSAATAITVESSMATAHNVVDITVTDATTLDAGRGRALYLKYTVSGTKTANFAVRTAAIDTYISNDCPGVTGLDMYMGNVDDKTVGGLSGIAMYCEDIGSATSGWIGIDLGRVIENVADDRDTFMRFKGHACTSRAKSIFYLEGSNSKLAAQFIMTAGAGESTGDWLELGINVASGYTCQGALRVGKEAVIGGGVTTQYYIPIYTAD